MGDRVLLACCRHRWEFCTPAWALENRPDVLVPKTACKSVVFIGSKDADGVFVPRATGFLVSAATYQVGAVFVPYLVTAEHVVTAMLHKGMAMHCRINLKDGSTAVVPLTGKWWHYPPPEKETDRQTDVAVMPFGLHEDVADHEYISLTNRPDHVDRIPRHGEEVFLMGLFKSHYGKKRNIPIVRIGNIAALPEEPVETRCGPMDAYLVEVRSIAGLSGSPVFKNAEGLMPYPRQKRAFSRAAIPKETSDEDYGMIPVADLSDQKIFEVEEGRRKREEIDWFDWHFVGLVHGHFDVKNFTEDTADDVSEDVIGANNEVNTGIAIVIPARKVLETIFQPDLQKEVWDMIRNARAKNGATADVDLSSAPKEMEGKAERASDNPTHKEDFTSLLTAAARGKPEASQT